MKTGRRTIISSTTTSNAVKKAAATSVCLFCCASASSWSTQPGQHGHHHHHHQDHQILFTGSGKDDGNLIQGHLRAIFVCRQVLRLSEEQVADYLSRNDGSLNPGGWFSVCSSCDAAVRECFTLQRRLVQLERKLEVVKLRLVNHIYSSGAEQRRIKKRRSSSSCQDLTFDIRETVLKELSVTQTQDAGIPRKVNILLREGMSINDSTGRSARDTDCRRPRMRSLAKKLAPVKLKSPNKGRKCRKSPGNGTSQSRQNNNNKTAPITTILRVRVTKTKTKFRLEGHDDDHGRTMDLEPLELEQSSLEPAAVDSSTLHNNNNNNPTTTPAEDSESSSEHNNFEDDREDPAEEEEEDSQEGSNKNDSSEGEGEPDSEVEDKLENHNTPQTQFRHSLLSLSHSKTSNNKEPSESPEDEALNPDGKEEIMSSSSPASLQSPQPQPLPPDKTGYYYLPSRYEYYTHRCAKCPASYIRKSHLSVHLKLHERGGQGSVVCSTCGWLVSEQRLKQHKLQFCRSSSNVSSRRRRKGKPSPRRKANNNNNNTNRLDKLKKIFKRIRIRKRVKVKKKRAMVVTEGIPYYCDHCPLIFPLEARLVRHCSKHHSDAGSNSSCQYCPAEFVSKQLLNRHVEAMHSSVESSRQEEDGAKDPPPPLEPEVGEEDSKPSTCPHCPETFPSKSKLDLHIAHLHKKALLACKSCKFKTDKYPKYAAHLQMHKRRDVRRAQQMGIVKPAKGTPFYCDHCHMIYPLQQMIKTHVRGSHSSAEYASCQLCASKFVSKQLLKLHVVEWHPEEEIREADGTGPQPPPEDDDDDDDDSLPKPCPHCPEQRCFPSKLKLDFHIAKDHKEALLTCPICQHKAREYWGFVEHARTHQDKSTREKRFACHLCGLSFELRKSLNYHMQLNHPQELGLPPDHQEVVCPICGVSMRTKWILKVHIKHVHEKKKEHFCEFCGKAFCTGTELRKHLLLHTAPRELQYKMGPFPCKYCDSEFNVRQGLYYHLKREHSDKYRFRCDKCGKGYCSKGALNQHQRDCKGGGGTTGATTITPTPPTTGQQHPQEETPSSST